MSDIGHRRVRTRAAQRLAAAVLAALALASASAQTPGTRERQIRAALVYKVSRFVTWPESALRARDEFTLCHVSDEPTSKVLVGIEGRPIQGLRARLRRLEALDARSLAGCNLLYLAGRTSFSAEAKAAALTGSMLVVVDGPRAGEDAGMVQLVPRENRVSLVVDLGMVRDANLRIDATLLQLVEVRK